MTLPEVMEELETMGTEQNRKVYRRHGADENQFGVSFANLNKLAKRIKKDNALAADLWGTGNADARNLATIIADPKTISAKMALAWIRSVNYYLHADLVGGRIATKHSEAHRIMEQCMRAKQDFVQQVGWDIAAALSMNGQIRDIEADQFLKTIEKGIAKAPNRTRHAMNNTVIAIGLRGPVFKKKAIATARRIGKVDVDHGETGCITPEAESYILKATAQKKSRSSAKS